MKHSLSLRDIVLASRPLSWPNTAIPFIIGYVLTGSAWGWVAVTATLFFIFPYNLLMYGVNDVFDYESDIKNPRKGGVEGGLLSPQQNQKLLWWSLLIPAPFVFILLFASRGSAQLWLVFTVFMVLAYSVPKLRFKERPFIDSFTSSTHFYGPLVFGLLFDNDEITFLPAIVAFALWGVASHALGAVQDIKSDRQARIKSIATEIGAQPTIVLSAACYTAAAVIVETAYGAIGLAAGVILLLYALNAVRYIKITDDSSPAAHGAWVLFLRLNFYAGFMLTQLFIRAYNPTQAQPNHVIMVTNVLLFAGGILGSWWLIRHLSPSQKYWLKNY